MLVNAITVGCTEKKTECIAYQMKMEGGSSGGPVFFTFGDDNPVEWQFTVHLE